MKNLAIIIFLFVSMRMDAQIVTTIAGGGTHGLGDGGPATAANIAVINTCVLDQFGNLYMTCLDNRVRKIDTLGIITTFAGNGTAGYTGDGGPATAAELNIPDGLTLDASGNIIFAEGGNNVIRKVNISTGIISTLFGTGVAGSGGDGGPATAAQFNDPSDVCFDPAGNLYIADLDNNKVRKVDAMGIISTFAGTAPGGFSGDGGPATAAELSIPITVKIDDTGNVYISDEGNNVIRKVNRSGIISTFAGNGTMAYIGDGMPALSAQFNPDDILIDKDNNLYIGDYVNDRVYKVDTAGMFHSIAGDGLPGFSGDGGPATAADFAQPSGLTIDHCGNLYIADAYNYRVRKVTYDSTCDPYGIVPLAIATTTPCPHISIYPNPTTNQLTITTPNTVKEVTISNLIGQTIFTRLYDQETAEINTSGLPPGVYQVRVSDGNGNTEVQKILKE